MWCTPCIASCVDIHCTSSYTTPHQGIADFFADYTRQCTGVFKSEHLLEQNITILTNVPHQQIVQSSSTGCDQSSRRARSPHHVSCPATSVHLQAETVVRVFIRISSPCMCSGRHVTVSVAEVCRTFGAVLTCS